MRYDKTQSEEFQNSKLWDEAESNFVLFKSRRTDDGTPEYILNSFSGNERNRLFLNRDKNFDDVSLVSGLDFKQDGRGFVLFDFDNDGWLDLGVNSNQGPRFRMMQNRFSKLYPDNHSLAIQLIGGQKTTEPSEDWSPRSPVGAELLVKTNKSTRAYLYSVGEGLSVQNSSWIHIGLASGETIREVEVRWPSGKVTFHSEFSERRTTLREDAKVE